MAPSAKTLENAPPEGCLDYRVFSWTPKKIGSGTTVGLGLLPALPRDFRCKYQDHAQSFSKNEDVLRTYQHPRILSPAFRSQKESRFLTERFTYRLFGHISECQSDTQSHQ